MEERVQDDHTLAEFAENLIKRMRADRGGHLYPEWEYAARADPAFVEAYAALTSHVLAPTGRALEPKVRELIFVAIVAHIGEPQGLRGHMRQARRQGATRREILETLETILPPAGVPAFLRGIKVLMELEREEPEHAR